jgi:hypothetical protein
MADAKSTDDADGGPPAARGAARVFAGAGSLEDFRRSNTLARKATSVMPSSSARSSSPRLSAWAAMRALSAFR